VKWSIKSDILNFFGEEFMFTLKHNFRIKCELGPGGIRSGILCWEKGYLKMEALFQNKYQDIILNYVY
jgi:hypothetical protein